MTEMYCTQCGKRAQRDADHRPVAMCGCKASLSIAAPALDNERTRGIHTCHAECQRLPCVQRREIERLKGIVSQENAARIVYRSFIVKFAPNMLKLADLEAACAMEADADEEPTP